MLIKNIEQVEFEPVEIEGAKNTFKKKLIAEKDGAENFFWRLFEVGKGGFTPFHQHPWEHEVYIKSGEGILVAEDKEHKIKTGDIIFIRPNEKHQFKNVSEEVLEFFCIIPNTGG